MTREHKLALIVGFALVLVLGVLLADHLSPARKNDLRAEARTGTPAQFGADGGGGGLNEPRGLLPSASHATTPEVAAATVEPPPRPMALTMGAPGGVAKHSGEPPVPPEIARRPLHPQPSTVSATDVRNAILSPTTALTTVHEEPIPASDAGQTGLPASNGSVQRHDVQEGDSIYSIASEVYGDGSLWTKIRDYPPNKDKISPSGGLRAGVTLLLPPKDVLLGNAVLADAHSTANHPSSPTASKPAVKTSVYVVKSGDSLAAIAQKKLGSSRRWQEIAELNKLEDEDSLRIGMTLKLPAR